VGASSSSRVKLGVSPCGARCSGRPQRFRELRRQLSRRACVQIAAGGGELGVAHRFLNAHQVDAARNEHRAVAVSEVVPAELAQPGRVASALVPAAQGGAVEPPALT